MTKSLLSQLLSPIALLVVKLGRIKQLWAFTMAKQQCQKVANSAVFMASPEVHGTGKVSVGERTLFYPGLYLETRSSGTIQIGSDVVCSRGVHLVAYEQIHIGSGTMIGEYTSIRDANHSKPQLGQSLRESGHTSRPIQIGSKVWIGRGVTILGGVRIGDGAVIAANAVVNQDVAAGSLVGGVPARVLKSAETSGKMSESFK